MQKLAKDLSDLIVYHKSVKFKLPGDSLEPGFNMKNFSEISSISETKAMKYFVHNTYIYFYFKIFTFINRIKTTNLLSFSIIQINEKLRTIRVKR